MKNANSSSKVQNKMGPIPDQVTGRHKEMSPELNAFTPAEELTYEYHCKAQLTTDGRKSQGAPVPASAVRAIGTTSEEPMTTL